MRQEIAKLVHQVDAAVGRVDAHMHVHPADQHPPHHAGQVAGQHVVAVLVGMGLVAPIREGVAGGRDRGEVVACRAVRHGGAQAPEILARLGHIAADAAADLDLAIEEFRADLILKPVAAILHQAGGRVGQREAVAIDQQVFFLDADGEFGVGQGHARSSCCGMMALQHGARIRASAQMRLRASDSKRRRGGGAFRDCQGWPRSARGRRGQSIALKLNSPPSLMPEGQREVTVLVRV